MLFKRAISAATAALVLSASPAFAGAPVRPSAVAPVSASGVQSGLTAGVRAGARSEAKNDLAGGGVIVAILAVAAIVAGIVVVADSDDEPNSP